MQQLSPNTYKEAIKLKALELGFSAIGVSKADYLAEDAPRLEKWLKENKHGKMAYMANHYDKRLDPRLLVDGAKTVISFLYNYFPAKTFTSEGGLKVSKYAYGQDYHEVIKDKLFELLNWIREHIGEVNGRAFVDSAPVLERSWAVKSGLGWIGKNGNIISKGNGSFFFLSELIVDLKLEPDNPMQTHHCGTCTACIDACPTQAIVQPGVVDGSRCISYFTIELRDAIPKEMSGQFDNWIFGCDTCQDVCPWNRFAKPHNEVKFAPNEAITTYSNDNWKEITEDVFAKVFIKSPIKRAGYNGLKRNIDFILNHDDEH